MFLRYMVLELASSFLKMIRHPGSYSGDTVAAVWGSRGFTSNWQFNIWEEKIRRRDGGRRLGMERVGKWEENCKEYSERKTDFCLHGWSLLTTASSLQSSEDSRYFNYWGTAATQFFSPVPGNTEVLFHVLIKQAWLESNCMQPAEAATASSAEEESGKSMHSACEDRWAGLRLRCLVSALLLQSSWLTSWNTSTSLCHSQTTFRWLPTNYQSQKSGQL